MEAVDGASSDEDEDDDGEAGETPIKSKSAVAGSKPISKIGKKKTGGTGRRRIDIKFIENKSRRQVTFSRRKRGLMKKVCLHQYFIFAARLDGAARSKRST